MSNLSVSRSLPSVSQSSQLLLCPKLNHNTCTTCSSMAVGQSRSIGCSCDGFSSIPCRFCRPYCWVLSFHYPGNPIRSDRFRCVSATSGCRVRKLLPTKERIQMVIPVKVRRLGSASSLDHTTDSTKTSASGSRSWTDRSQSYRYRLDGTMD